MRLLPLALALVLAPACGQEAPVAYSAPVSINLKAKSGDADTTANSEEKKITDEANNPYGAFVRDARDALGGYDPSRLEIDDLEIFLGARSDGVASLDEIFTGRVEALIRMDGGGSNNSYLAAEIDDPAGSTARMRPVFAADASDFSAVDYDLLLRGDFKVSLRGPSAEGWSSKGAEADLQLTFRFTAYE